MPKKTTRHHRKIAPGQTMQTRDEFLSSGKGKTNIKPDHPNSKDLYRRIAVVATNNQGAAAIVKLTKQGKHKLPEYGSGQSTYKPLVEIYDNEGNFIKPKEGKFHSNPKRLDLSAQDTQNIYDDCFKNAAPKTRAKNLKLLNELKYK